ncbi:MAG: hypothetical protein KDA84_30590, partial [Planctomycetaceae bacterium]|nr:hypothetical protein [Planctomycetaceae bacterium]
MTRTYEGIDIDPLYTARDQRSGENPDGFPGEPPFVRGDLQTTELGWDLRQEHAHPDLDSARAAIHEDLNGGVTSLLLRFDSLAQSGKDPGSSESSELDGLMVYSAEDLEALLQEVDFERVPIALDAGSAFLPAASLLASVWARRGIDTQKVRGAFNADPWSALARKGELPVSPDVARSQLVELAEWTAKTYPNVTAVGVDTSPYHHAGATATQDIALAIATGVDYLRTLTKVLPLDVAAKQILFRISVGTHHFLSIAKLRAARRLWWRVIEASGGDASVGGMRLHVRTSQRVLTERDPFVNLLRNTVGVFAGGMGGAECITSVPFDTRLGPPDEFSRRIARNTLLILQEEGLLNLVADPAGGSWYLDHLTDQFA